jgi:UDP-glucose 4-epimerase
MNILIIGGAGYIGGVTAHLAQKAGHTVTVFDNLSTGRAYNVPEGARLITGDINDRGLVQSVLNKDTYDAVMHFAARILVPESMKQPWDYFETNTFGAMNVVDAAANNTVKAYILSSTAATYGEPAHVPLTEADVPSPVNPYGWSKLLTEQILQSYHITHKLQWTAFRYFNVAGAFDGVGTDYPYVSHIIPNLLLSMRSKTPITIAGNDYNTPDGTCIRDYVHVVDIARAHLIAAEKMFEGTEINQPINLSSGHGYSVKEVAETFNDVTHAGLPIKTGPRRAGDPAKLYASNDRAKKLLGWQPELDLRTIIKDHYDWYMVQKNPNAPIARP